MSDNNDTMASPFGERPNTGYDDVDVGEFDEDDEVRKGTGMASESPQEALDRILEEVDPVNGGFEESETDFENPDEWSDDDLESAVQKAGSGVDSVGHSAMSLLSELVEDGAEDAEVGEDTEDPEERLRAMLENLIEEYGEDATLSEVLE